MIHETLVKDCLLISMPYNRCYPPTRVSMWNNLMHHISHCRGINRIPLKASRFCRDFHKNTGALKKPIDIPQPEFKTLHSSLNVIGTNHVPNMNIFNSLAFYRQNGLYTQNFNPISVSSYIQEDSISHSNIFLHVAASSSSAAYWEQTPLEQK